MKKPNAPKFVIFQEHKVAEKYVFKTDAEWEDYLKDHRIAINPQNVCKVYAVDKRLQADATKYRISSPNRVRITTSDGWQSVEIDGTFEEVLAALSL